MWLLSSSILTFDACKRLFPCVCPQVCSQILFRNRHIFTLIASIWFFLIRVRPDMWFWRGWFRRGFQSGFCCALIRFFRSFLIRLVIRHDRGCRRVSLRFCSSRKRWMHDTNCTLFFLFCLSVEVTKNIDMKKWFIATRASSEPYWAEMRCLQTFFHLGLTEYSTRSKPLRHSSSRLLLFRRLCHFSTLLFLPRPWFAVHPVYLAFSWSQCSGGCRGFTAHCLLPRWLHF